MKLTLRANKLGEKLLLLSTAFVLAVSTLTASVPFILSSEVGAAPAAGKRTVTGNTSAGYNLSGWLFNRDLAYATPTEFVASDASIGRGSLYVPALSTTEGARKFIGENFIFTQMSELNSLSVDYKLGSASQARQVYMTVYANYATSAADKYYDCKYDAVAVGGVPGTYSTLIFNTASTYTVSGVGCPASPAAMGAGATVRAYSLNFGGTSLSDAGMSVHFDNATVVTTAGTTIYDFEPVPDTTAPVITINGATTAKAYYGPGTVRIQVADDNYDKTVIEQKNANGVYVERFVYDASKDTSFTIQWLGDGEYRVRATDTWGNSSRVLTFAIDANAPQTTLNTPALNSTVGARFTISGNATDSIALSRVYVQLVNRENGQRYGGQTVYLSGKEKAWSHTFDANASNMPEGTYAVHASVVDNAGNSSNVGWTANFKLDKTAPSLTLGNLSEGQTIATAESGKLTINGSFSDPAGGYAELQLVKNGTSHGLVTVHAPVVNGILAQFNTAGLETGAYTLVIRATDYLGNARPTQNINFNLDPSFADVFLAGPSNGATVRGVQRFTIESNEDISKWLFTLDGRSYASQLQRNEGTNSWYVDIDTRTIANGTHSVTLRATDTAGNVRYWNNRGDKHSFVIDNAAPTITSWAFVPNTPVKSADTAVTVKLSATDNFGITSASYNLYSDAGDLLAENVQLQGAFNNPSVDITSLIDVSALISGTYKVVLTVRDAAGNTDARESEFVVNNDIDITLEDIDASDSTPLVSGRIAWVVGDAGIANMPIAVTVGGVLYDDIETDSEGNWSVQTTIALANGEQRVRVVIDQLGVAQTFSYTVAVPAVAIPLTVTTDSNGTPQTSAGSAAQTPVPAFVSPAAIAGILGDSTEANNSDNTNDEDVRGVSTLDTVAQAVDADNTDGKAMGLAWYWWLLIAAAVALIGWWIAAAIRNRQAN